MRSVLQGDSASSGWFLIVLVIANASCQDAKRGSRPDRYAGGGRFVGARPQMSPDSNWIVFSSPVTGNGDLYLLELQSGKLARLTASEQYEGDASWSADSKRLVFVREDQNRLGRICILDLDSSEVSQITTGNHYDAGPVFVDNDERIVFHRTIHPRLVRSTELFIVDVDGRNVVKLTDDDLPDMEIAYCSDTGHVFYSKNWDSIWRTNLDGSGSKFVTLGHSPAITTDGRYLAFLSDRYDRYKSSLFISESASLKEEEVAPSRPFKSYASFPPIPDTVMYLEEPTARGTGRIILLNWRNGSRRTVLDTEHPMKAIHEGPSEEWLRRKKVSEAEKGAE